MRQPGRCPPSFFEGTTTLAALPRAFQSCKSPSNNLFPRAIALLFSTFSPSTLHSCRYTEEQLAIRYGNLRRAGDRQTGAANQSRSLRRYFMDMPGILRGNLVSPVAGSRGEPGRVTESGNVSVCTWSSLFPRTFAQITSAKWGFPFPAFLPIARPSRYQCRPGFGSVIPPDTAPISGSGRILGSVWGRSTRFA